MILALAVLCATMPNQSVVKDRVDVIEVNEFYNRDAEVQWCQVIFWDWNSWHSRYEVVAWRMEPKAYDRRPQMQPKRIDGWRPPPPWKGGGAIPMRRNGEWVSFFRDRGDRVWREVTAPIMCHTHTYWDPEVLNRKQLPSVERRGFAKPWRRR